MLIIWPHPQSRLLSLFTFPHLMLITTDQTGLAFFKCHMFSVSLINFSYGPVIRLTCMYNISSFPHYFQFTFLSFFSHYNHMPLLTVLSFKLTTFLTGHGVTNNSCKTIKYLKNQTDTTNRCSLRLTWVCVTAFPTLGYRQSWLFFSCLRWYVALFLAMKSHKYIGWK